MRSSYGKKGGTGPTADRKATIYDVLLPDGRTVTKRSFFIDSPLALCGIYCHAGTWYASGIADADTIKRWPGQQAAPATRIVKP